MVNTSLRTLIALAACTAPSLSLSACSSSTSSLSPSIGSASLDGGNAFIPNLAFTQPQDDLSDGGSDLGAVYILLGQVGTDVGGTCSGLYLAVDAGLVVEGYRVGLLVATNNLDNGGPKVGPGSYPIFAPGAAPDGGLNGPNAGLTLDVLPNGNTIGTGVSGSVELSATGASYYGTFTTVLKLVDGGSESLAGSFSAPFCIPPAWAQ